jgi:hypothetical protein
MRIAHVEFNQNNLATIQRRIDDVKSKIANINIEEEKLKEEKNFLAIELAGTEEFMESFKRQNPEQFLLLNCPQCNGSGIENAYKDQNPDVIDCSHCFGSGEILNKEFIEKNNFTITPYFKADEADVYGYCLDNSGKRIHIYNIRTKETICKTKNHTFQIVEESDNQCSICKRNFNKLKSSFITN